MQDWVAGEIPVYPHAKDMIQSKSETQIVITDMYIGLIIACQPISANPAKSA